jgi:hypothetical protein
MPTISLFYGIAIQMFLRDHAPPHFHVTYGSDKAVISIETLTVIAGKLPRRALNLALDWAELHQAELLENWHLCETKQLPNPIPPLK